MIEWNNLRAWEGSQQLAFEELCCQLASSENPRSTRKGTPDAGVECYWQSANGDEYAWQAKFFLSPSQVDWSQLDKSVKTAIEKHPRLVRYTVCLPIDRPDARQDNKRSMMDRWNEHVEKWQKWAQEQGRTTEFDYWGNHEIFMFLSQEKHSGRYFFWFHKDYFSNDWFKKRTEVAIAGAGERYLPELNVELAISDLFAGLGRTDDFYI